MAGSRYILFVQLVVLENVHAAVPIVEQVISVAAQQQPSRKGMGMCSHQQGACQQFPA